MRLQSGRSGVDEMGTLLVSFLHIHQNSDDGSSMNRKINVAKAVSRLSGQLEAEGGVDD